MNATMQIKEAPEGAVDNAKRQQIVDGARKIFLAQGFDAASMNDIARAAGVSKGTLYVYFANKEQLFAAIVEAECLAHAEGVFDLDLARFDLVQVRIVFHASEAELDRVQLGNQIQIVFVFLQLFAQRGGTVIAQLEVDIDQLHAGADRRRTSGLVEVDPVELA